MSHWVLAAVCLLSTHPTAEATERGTVHFWTLGAFPTESRLQVETRNDQIHVAL